MKIAVIGLGLIGGSFAKAFKKFTEYDILGYDIDETVMEKAVADGTVDGRLRGSLLNSCDIILLALYPDGAIRFVKENANNIRKDAIITDCAGVKAHVMHEMRQYCSRYGFTFIGMHPMAGTEKIGYDYSKADMFLGGSLIVTPYEDTEKCKVNLVRDVFMKLGFGKIQLSTAEEHDKIIAYTSQLAHVVSSSYVKRVSTLPHKGFSAGSYADMTRVAFLNEKMWTELFLENSKNLSNEIDTLICELKKYSDAIKNGDEKRLFELLRDGREIKERSDLS